MRLRLHVGWPSGGAVWAEDGKAPVGVEDVGLPLISFLKSLTLLQSVRLPGTWRCPYPEMELISEVVEIVRL